MKNIILASLLWVTAHPAVIAATSLNPAGNIRVDAGWSNNKPSANNEGTVAVDGVSSNSDLIGYGTGAIVNHTAGDIVAQVVGTKRRGFNLNGGGTWVMTNGSITARYFNANGSNAVFDLSGGSFILDTADTSITQFQMNNGGLYKISGSVILDGSDATASPLVGSGAGYDISSSWTGSWIQGNHSGTDWKTVFTGNAGYMLDGVSISNQVFDDNFLISSDGKTLTLGTSSDTDNDGIEDVWEIANGLNVGIDDSAFDNDSNGGPDGLTNLQEFLRGTDPQDADTDDDNLLDGVETLTGIFVSSTDTGTNPTLPDTDGDGINDGDEIGQGSSPVDPGDPTKTPITVYLLGGQSNMEGSSFVSGNTPEENLSADLFEIPEILIYLAGSAPGTNASLSNQLINLQPHAMGSGGVAIGPEIGFGERMRELCPGKKIAFLKYSYRGTNLATQWNPGANNNDIANWGEQYTAFVSTINNGLTALRAAGYEPNIEGMLWMQGENDANNTARANAYGANLNHFITRVREQFATDTAPSGIRFVAGQVLPAPNSNFPGRDTVRQAILNVDEDSGHSLSLPNTSSVPTNSSDHPLRTDDVHLNLVGILALGRSMAYHILDLEELDYDQWATSNQLTGGENDDDDNDGISNNLEFALGGDPRDASDRPPQSIGTIDIDGESYPSYVFSRNLNASDTIVRAALSYDLEDWSSLTPIFVSSMSQPDGTATITYRGLQPFETSSPPRAFFRIEIE